MELANMSIGILRMKHKTVLIDHALRIHPVEGDAQKVRTYWLQRLLEGSNVLHMLAYLKACKPLPEEHPLTNYERNATKEIRYDGIAEIKQKLNVMRTGMPEKLRIAINNHTKDIWECNEVMSINACYHWLAEHGEMFYFEGIRTPLPRPILPNSSLELEITVVPPTQPGLYQLQLTMVHEGVGWFEEGGFTATKHPITIESWLPASTSRVLEEFTYGQIIWHGQESVV